MIPVHSAPTIGVAVFGMMEEGVAIGQWLPVGRVERRIHPMVRMIGPGMVEHHVEDHRDAALVRRIDQCLELIWPAVEPLGRHVEDRVVAPRTVAGKFADRHQFDGVDAQPGQMVKLCAHTVEIAVLIPPQTLRAGEVTHAQLVDHQVTQRRPPPRLVAPEIRRIIAQERLRSRLIPADFPRIGIGDRDVAGSPRLAGPQNDSTWSRVAAQ